MGVKKTHRKKHKMSDLCDIFPDNPECQEEPAPEEVEPEENVEESEGEGEEVEEEGEGEEEEGEATEKTDHIGAAKAAVADWTMVKDHSTMAMLNPFMSNLTYFGVSAGSFFWALLQAFRYRSHENYYDGVKIGDDTNWWKLTDMIRLYSTMGISGILMITQLLATLGIMVPLNAYLWMIIGGLGGMIVSVTVGVMRFIGYDGGYSTW